jgi:hypothetical protein
MSHLISTILALVSGVLVSSDLIISRTVAIRINRTLWNWLNLSTIKKTFVVAGILAVVGVAAWIIYLVLKESHSGSPTNIWWLGIFAAGFFLGLAMQWFSIHLLRRRFDEFYAIFFSSIWLIILGVIIFASTIHNIHAVQFTIGMLYGICMIEFSILATKFFTWFWTTDPNPEREKNRRGSNPRVLARIGISFFIIAGIIEVVISLT